MKGTMGSRRESKAAVKPEWDVGAEEAPIEAESAAIEQRLRNIPERFKQGLISFGRSDASDDDENEGEDIIALADIIDLTSETPSVRQKPTNEPIRNPPVPPEELVECYELNRAKIQPGSTIEIQMLDQPQLFKAAFLHVQLIINKPDGIVLRGIPFTRMRNLRGRIPRLRNELAMILHIDSDDNRPDEIQAAIEVPIANAIKVRNCHFTNADFPQHRTVLGIHKTIEDLEEHGVLMCRWRYTLKYRDSATRVAHNNQTKKSAAPLEVSIEHLTAKQVRKKRFEVSETKRFNVWRGGKVRGGEHDPGNDNSPVRGPVVHLDGEDDPELVLIEKKPGQRYTFGDMFCGAGGASCGARKAGFQIKVGCDHHLGACRTYADVFPEAELYMLDIFEFITNGDIKARVDVLHLSPPCQFWSPAHTCAGVNDDANIAVLFSCHELIKKLRPRIFTLEQTFGILHPRFEFYFNALVHGFTQYNYSVRWKIVDLVDWGSPATRKRLVMIGSCPGEELPPFPAATHVAPGVKKRGKKPHVTVKRMLERIPRDAAQYDDMHQPHEMVRKRLERWDPDVTLKRCITTNGGYGNYHPNGRRDFTLREYATLQTFPVDYPFQNPDRKKQIGNAFPPMVVKVLYTHLRKWLEGRDRVYAIENEPIDPDDPDVEILDLEDDGLLDDDTSDDEDVEYVGSQHHSSPSSPSENSDVDDMDLDTGDGDYGPVPCIDANQRRQVWSTIDLTEGRIHNPQDYIDLTGDEID
ncbi:S-adenosyl-L-methionine-dependent methyltransferase [Nemania abortiva]|nr:S-adenosyl-L-methionine-dependent methyltransferase [Nemania abortiva]